MTPRDTGKRVLAAAMRLFKNAYRPRYPELRGPHDYWEHDGMHGSHDNEFAKACAAHAKATKGKR